jgi:hypothetical protein
MVIPDRYNRYQPSWNSYKVCVQTGPIRMTGIVKAAIAAFPLRV